MDMGGGDGGDFGGGGTMSGRPTSASPLVPIAVGSLAPAELPDELSGLPSTSFEDELVADPVVDMTYTTVLKPQSLVVVFFIGNKSETVTANLSLIIEVGGTPSPSRCRAGPLFSPVWWPSFREGISLS
jgi:hypothetical protein